MVLKRKIYDKLLEWKKECGGTKAILIEGARRIGKSTVCEVFGQNEYETYILIDFAKKDATVEEYFVRYLNDLGIDGIKIHMLYILRDTPLAKYYEKNKFYVLTKEEYIDVVCEQLANLDSHVVIHRITGDPKREDLIEPTWLLKKFCVLNDIDKEMKMRDIYQGCKLSK